MTILISGASGFLGSYLLKEFVNKNFKVIALKRSSSDTHRISEYLDKVTVYDVDNIELSFIFKNHNIDVIINTVTNYGRKDKKISSIVNTNLMFSLKLLEESVNNKIMTFINTDTLLDRNINSYSLAKSQFVDWMKILSKNDTQMVNIKIEHMYGPLDDENKFVGWLINQLKSNVDKIDLTSGIQKRDFIYIDDIVNAYLLIIKNINKLSSYEEFELGNGESLEVRKFINLLSLQISNNQLVTTKLNFGAIKYRDKENMDMKADTRKLESLGWKPKTTLDNGINKILDGVL